MQQPDLYYLLDGNSGRSQQPDHQTQYFNKNLFPGPSSHNETFDIHQPLPSSPTQKSSEVAESSTSVATAMTGTKGGTDFRRRKNWSERILVEITGLLHVLSPTGKILYCSESTHELTGYRPHELVGRALMDFLHVDDMDVFIRDFQMSFHTRSQIKTHYRFRRKDETYVIFEVVGHPKADVPGQPPQSFFGIAQPVPTKSGVLIDTFLELKAENYWLKKRIEELSSKYGSADTTVSTANASSSANHQETTSMDDSSPLRDDWMDGPNTSDFEDHLGSGGGGGDGGDGSEPNAAVGNYKEESSTGFGGRVLDVDATQIKEKWKRRKKHKGADEYVCADCGTTTSPEWRKGPHGPKTLCNACGLRWAKKNKKKDLNDD